MRKNAMGMEIPDIRVLFQSRTNAIRAQLAAQLLNHLGRGKFLATTAMELNQGIDPRVAQVLGEINIDPEKQLAVTPRGVPSGGFDYVINLCDHSQIVCEGRKSDCPPESGGEFSTCWGFAAPSDDADHEEVLQLLRRTRDDIASRLCIWIPAAERAKKGRTAQH